MNQKLSFGVRESIDLSCDEVIAAARQAGSSERQELTRIVCFENMSDYTHQLDSVVPMDEPIFKATPSEIRFANFVALLTTFLSFSLFFRSPFTLSSASQVLRKCFEESLQSLDATLHLRNQDNVARRVKILQPDSSFFQILPKKGRKADQMDNKALFTSFQDSFQFFSRLFSFLFFF